MLISLIAAMTPGRAIGVGGKLPWYLPADLQRFKLITSGHTVIMGRKTFNSIGRALPNRHNFVLSRSAPKCPPANTHWFTNLPAAFAAAEMQGETEVFVIGGGEVYTAALPQAHKLYLTLVHQPDPPNADAWFPPWQKEQLQLTEQSSATEMDFLTYTRH